MSIQAIGSSTQAFQPPITGDTTGRRSTPASPDGSVPQVETQTPHAASQAKPVNDTSSGALKKEDVQKDLNKINDFVQARASNVQFVTDEDTGINVVKVVDTSTKEVIRQMPTVEALQIAKALDQLKGLLIRQKA